MQCLCVCVWVRFLFLSTVLIQVGFFLFVVVALCSFSTTNKLPFQLPEVDAKGRGTGTIVAWGHWKIRPDLAAPPTHTHTRKSREREANNGTDGHTKRCTTRRNVVNYVACICFVIFSLPLPPPLHHYMKGRKVEGGRRDDGHTVATDRIRSPCRATQFFYRAILFPRLAAQVKILNSFIYFLLVLFFASSLLCFPNSPSPFLCLMHQPQRGYDRVISPVLPLSGCSFPSMDFGRVFCPSLHYFQTKMRSLCVCMCFCCLR